LNLEFNEVAEPINVQVLREEKVAGVTDWMKSPGKQI
jgi:hypothetical protein